VLRAALRIFYGAGPEPELSCSDVETTGDGEDPEVRDPRRAVPLTMTVAPAVLLAGSLAVGVVPAVGRALAAAARVFEDRAGYVADVQQLPVPAPAHPVPEAAWTTSGVLLGLLSTGLAVALASVAVFRPDLRWSAARVLRDLSADGDRRLIAPLRRLHSGLVGDYLTWFTVGLAVLLLALSAQM
jgi:hypothetical protein